ncbi:MAG: diguanylate cyclase [Candidatus Firestonebacteria bacterium]|nr:diguanylate cyclase [Candidatus Firestonebacteria bacterium]
MNYKPLLPLASLLQARRESLLASWVKSEPTGAKAAAGKSRKPKKSIFYSEDFFKVFFPLSGNTKKKTQAVLTPKPMQAAAQAFLDGHPLVFEFLWDLLLQMRAEVAACIPALPRLKQTGVAEAWDAYWLQGCAALFRALLQTGDQTLQARNRVNSVLFHTVQSLASEPDLNVLLEKIVAHTAELLHAKPVYLFWALQPGPENHTGLPRLILRASSLSGGCGEYSLAFGEGPIGQAATQGKADLVNEYKLQSRKIPFLSEFDQLLIVPIVFSGEVLGVMVAAQKYPTKGFGPEDLELLVVFMNQTAATLKTVMLYHHQTEAAAVLEEKNRILEEQADTILIKKAQLEVVNEIGQQINSSLDLPEVLALLTRHTAESIGVDRTIVWLMNDKKTGLEAVAAYGFPKQQLNRLQIFLPDVRKTRFFQALFERHAVEVTAEEDHAFFQSHLEALGVVKTLLVVPLLLQQQAIGLLTVDDTREAHPFLEDEVTLISAVANQATLAIENARLYQQVKEQAITDVMTGLYNHRYFQLRFAEEFSNCKRYRNAMSVIMMDIDFFKHYNDTYGHIAGDLALREIAQLTKASVRENDILARYGGEEFVIVLPMTNTEGATIVAERIRQAVYNCKFLGDFNLPQVAITVSLGIAGYSSDHVKCETLLREADQALYQAKENGRNRVVVHPESASADAADEPAPSA